MRTVRGLLEEGVSEGVFPGAVALVAHRDEVIFFDAVGYRSSVSPLAPMTRDTIFDLASLTKPLGTTLAMMKLADTGAIDLDEPVSGILRGSGLREKGSLTPRLLLCHSAGLAEWRPFHLELGKCPPEDRKIRLRHLIIEEPLSYRPGEGWLYSDLGFMFLEWVIEERAGMILPRFLDRHFYGPLGLQRTFFSHLSRPLPYPKDQFAATEDCPWRKHVLCGEVHDENAFAAGGYSGHAGLFGTAGEVYVIADLLRHCSFGRRQDFLKPETVRGFFTRQGLVEGSTWALGWDAPSAENSSAGKLFSRNSMGHLGFTGTSIWMDLDRDVMAILLTNRVHPTRANEKIRAFRPRFHDLVMEEVGMARKGMG